MRGRRGLAAALVGRSGAWRLGRALAPSRLLVLAYHRIGDAATSPLDPDLFSADVDGFDRQVRFLKRHYTVIGLEDLAEAIARRTPRLALITFDDGYRDNAEGAGPVLARHGVPGVFFVSTGFIDAPSLPWWDQLAFWLRHATADRLALDARWGVPALERPAGGWMAHRGVLLARIKQLPWADVAAYLAAVEAALRPAEGSAAEGAGVASSLWMTWPMLQGLRRSGSSIGGHTVTHPVLANLPYDMQLHEIAGCRARLAAQVGSAPVGLSYPVGGPRAFNAETRRAMTEAGFTFGFSYHSGTQSRDAVDPLAIRRLAVERDLHFDQFKAICSYPALIS